MALTPRNIWSPDAGDDYALTTDLATLADTVDTAIDDVETSLLASANYGVGTTAQRTAALAGMNEGAMWYDTDTSSEYRKVSSAWVLWTTEWATWATAPTGLTVGNGSLLQMYRYEDGDVRVKGSLVFGSTTTLTSTPTLTHPVAAAAPHSLDNYPLGLASLLEAGVQAMEGFVKGINSTTCWVRTSNSAGTYTATGGFSSTVPFTWGLGDQIMWRYEYTPA